MHTARLLNKKTAPYIFLTPVLILFFSFMLFPIVQSFIYSFQVFQQGSFRFVGLANYRDLLNDQLFRLTMFNTFLLLFVQVPIQLTLALVIANLMNSRRLRLRGFFRVSYFLPALTALVAYAIVFQVILNENHGVMNFVVRSLGFEPAPWLSSRNWARASLMSAITWRWTGYNMVIMLAGLQSIPSDLYESASIDGASSLRQFKSITIPMLKPIILFCAVLSTVGTLQLFDESFILTRGGPNNATRTITHYLYQQGFQRARFGYASAISYVMVAFIAILSYIQFKVAGENE